MGDPLTIGGALVGIGGAIPAILDNLGTITSLLKAQEGLSYNNHTFKLPPIEPALTVPTSKSGKSDAPATIQGKLKSNPSTELSIRRYGLLDVSIRSSLSSGSIMFNVALVQIAPEQYIGGYVQLYAFNGFDTAVGAQANFEFQGFEDSTKGYILTFVGMIDPVGSGLYRVTGSTLVQNNAKPVPLSCHVAPSTRENENSFSANIMGRGCYDIKIQ